jgi:hypothetical protein
VTAALGSNLEIECAIARWWPDIATIMVRTGATRLRVEATISYLNWVHNATHREHDCATHPAGSDACYTEHRCRGEDCKAAAAQHAAHRARVICGVLITDLDTARLRQLHAAYERGNRDPIVIAGHREYHRVQEAARIGRRRAEVAS